MKFSSTEMNVFLCLEALLELGIRFRRPWVATYGLAKIESSLTFSCSRCRLWSVGKMTLSCMSTHGYKFIIRLLFSLHVRDFVLQVRKRRGRPPKNPAKYLAVHDEVGIVISAVVVSFCESTVELRCAECTSHLLTPVGPVLSGVY